MNKHTHRLVFDRRRGMRVPAAEHARSAGKAAGGQTRAAVAVGVLSLIAMSDCALAQLRTDSGAAAGAISRLPSQTWGSARVSAGVAAALNRARPNLPTYTADGKWALNTGEYSDPTYSADGRIMTLVQNGKTIVLNWDTFDISKGYELRFEQKAGDRALNRVHDIHPSVIDGGLSGRGEIAIENRNGVVFGPNARVQAGSLVATALSITKEAFEKNFRNFRDGVTPAFGSDEENEEGFIGIEAGAEIKALAGGDVIMVAPRIVNKGRIETPKGQAILAAGQKVYLYAQTDLAQRGLMVAVDNFARGGQAPDLGTVVHQGVVQADKGSINLVGAAIRQKGRLTATTAVKGENGAIYLQAMEDTYQGSAPKASNEVGSGGSGKARLARKLGVIELAEGSVTEVLPSSEGFVLNAQGLLVAAEPPKEPAAIRADADPAEKAAYEAALQRHKAELAAYEASTQKSSDTFYRSRIDIIGADITLRSGSQVLTPAGEVNILAAEDWSSSVFYKDSNALVRDKSLVRLESGAVVDASGLDNVRLPGSRHQLKGRLFSIELADSPLQRGGVIYRSELLADARRVVSVGDVSGLYNNWRYTAGELSTVGGIVRLQSQGFLDLMPGAKVDFSGGSVVFEAASVTSSLLAGASTGAYTRVEDADAGTFYSAFLSDPSRATAGELARFGLSADAVAGANVPETRVGKSAGAALLAAPSMRVDATLDGRVFMNEQQRASGVSSALRGGYTADGKSFALTQGWSEWTDEGHAVPWDAALSLAPNRYTTLRPNAGTLAIGNEVRGEIDGVPLGQVVDAVRITSAGGSGMNEAGEFVVSASLLQAAGLGALHVMGNRFSLGNEGGGAASLRLTPGAIVEVRTLGHIGIDGALTAAGGSIGLTSVTGSLSVAKGSSLSVAGIRRDERFEAAPANEAADITAGTLKLSAGQGMTLQGSLDVSAGVWRTSAGAFRKGDAGTLDLSVNTYRPNASQELSHTLVWGEGFSLAGHDFDDGAKLFIKGLPELSIGERFTKNPGDLAFRVNLNALAAAGFGAQSFEAIGDVTVGLGEQVAPVLRNLVQDPTRSSGVSLARVDTLPQGRRAATQLSLTAKAQPTSLPPAADAPPEDPENPTPRLSPTGLEQGADLLVEAGARIDVGAGGGITLKAGGNIDVQGELVARGGQVRLALEGQRGSDSESSVESFGYLPGQHIRLHEGALVDVSGVVRSYRPDGEGSRLGDEQVRVFGEVLGGGSVTVGNAEGGASRGRFVMDVGANIRLDGASAFLDFGRVVNKRLVAAGAGTLTIGVTDGFELLGGLSAQAGHSSVAGGTVKVTLTQDRLADRTAVNPYPTGDATGQRTIHVEASAAAARNRAEQQLSFGEGVLSSEGLLNAGFERISLRADHSIALHKDAHLRSLSPRGPLQSVVLDAPLINLADQGRHLVIANHVGLGQFSPAVVNRGPLQGAEAGSTVAAAGGLQGTGTLAVRAGLIEVSGDVGIQGAELTALDATLDRQGGSTRRDGEVRLIGAREVNRNDLKGQLSYSGWLNVRAGQLYATTLSGFSVSGHASASGLNLFTLISPDGGSTSQAPLSALATLSLKADTIALDGLIRQPFGRVDLSANKELITGKNGRVSVSGLQNDGSNLLVPVGSTVNQTQWVYATHGAVGTNGLAEVLDPSSNKTQLDLSKLQVDKRVTLNGQTLSLSESSLVDGRAGGDLVAWEFKKGVGGSKDTYNRPGVYAILPGRSFDFAPHDADISASSAKLGKALQAGDQVTVTTGSGVLAAGTYTLLDARYGVLPGAVLVQATSLNTTQTLPQAIANDDGSVIVSGFLGAAGSARQSGSPKLALKLEPEATHRAQSQVIRTSANAYLDQLSQRTGDPYRRAGDAAVVSFVSKTAFDLAAQVRLEGRDGLRAGLIDLAMPDIQVSRTQLFETRLNDQGEQVEVKVATVRLDALQATGAESILLGGTRQLNADGGWDVKREANSVRFVGEPQAGGQPPREVNLSVQGELLAVATQRVQVDDGVRVSSVGTDDGQRSRHVIQRDGAALLVGNRVDTELNVAGVSADAQGELVLGRSRLEGRAVQLDATGALKVDSGAQVQAQSLGLGAPRVAVGASADDALAEGTLNLSGELLDQLNQGRRLQLRAYQGMDFYRTVTLGSTTMDRLSLDTPLLRGVGTVEQVATVKAREVVLSNLTGRTPDTTSQTAQGGSSIRIEASPALREGRTGGVTVSASAGNSAQAISGQHLAFANAVIASRGDVVFDGRGKLSAQADLKIEAARVTASADAEQTVATEGGSLIIDRAEGAKTQGESLGAGGALTLSGQRVEQRGVIDIESGRLTLQGAGQAERSDTIVFAEQSTTSVAGRTRQVSENLTVASHGGRIDAKAAVGQIVVGGVLDASAPVMPKGQEALATDAGRITLQATGDRGAVVVGDSAKLRLEAVSGGQGGTLQVDARRVLTAAQAEAEVAGAQQVASQIDALVKAAQATAQAGATAPTHHRVAVRVREGDAVLNTQLRAQTVQLTADGGDLTLGSSTQVLADAEAGGLVQLQARDDLTLSHGAKLSARSSREGANGGDVLLSSTDGRVRLGDAKVVADGTTDASRGRIVVRAGQDGSDIRVDRLTDDGQADDRLTLQAGQVDLVGVQVYQGAQRTSLVSGNTTATAWGLTSLHADADAFTAATPRQAMLDRLGLTAPLLGAQQVNVKAEAEIRSSGAFALSGDLNFERGNAKVPMNLTVRAGGDLTVQGNVSAGFGAVGKVAATAVAPTSVSATDAASFRFVAGANLQSADLLAVQSDASKGHFELAGDKHIRTTAGSIEVAASGDVRLLSNTASPPQSSAIYVAGRLNSDLVAAYPWAQHTDRGGRLSVSAGRDVRSLRSDKVTAQALTQLTPNYFFHAGASEDQVAWWTAFDSFRQGLGSFGGGNLSVQAGRDVRDMPVVSLTNAGQLMQGDGTQALRVAGGGDVDVVAEGDIAGGHFVVARGDGRLRAGGGVTRGAGATPAKDGSYTTTQVSTQPLPAAPILAAAAGRWSVKADQGVEISHVYNPTLLPNAIGGNKVDKKNARLKAEQAGVYVSYTSDAGVSMFSTRGDVALAPNQQALRRIVLSLPETNATPMPTDLLQLDALSTVLPSVFQAVSLQGDVSVNGAGLPYLVSKNGQLDGVRTASARLYITPSDQADLRVYAGQDLSLRNTLQVLDTDQAPVLLGATLGAEGFKPIQSSGLAAAAAELSNTGSRVREDFAALVNGNESSLQTNPLSQAENAGHAGASIWIAGRDIRFDRTDSSAALLRVNRPTELIAGRDILNPVFLGQNFNEDDVTRLSAGRDILGGAFDTGAIALGGPGQLRVEAGRDVLLEQSTGIAAIGNSVNQALPEQGAKITVAAGMARSVDLPATLSRHGSDAALRGELRKAVAATGLPQPAGRASWADASDAEVEATFATLTQATQVAALQRYLDARFVAEFLPELAGRDEAYYRSDAFKRLKHEAMWQRAQALTSEAASIKGSDNAAEEARRKARRQALYEQAARVVELAGLGQAFERNGLVNLANGRVHNRASGGGSAFSLIDNSQGGIDVIAADDVLAGLPSPGQARGFVNFAGGSFRSLSGGDFLAGDQKVIVAGRGNLYIYSTDGDIDSGQGSNNEVSQVVPRRLFDTRLGRVVTSSQPPLTGAGFQTILTPDDVEPVVGLYAPNGEIRALDAFIVGKVELAAPAVKGADNIAGQAPSGAAAPTPSLNLTPKLADTQAGVDQVSQASSERKQSADEGKLSVELLGLGAEGEAAAAGAVRAGSSGEAPSRQRDDKEREREPSASQASGEAGSKPGAATSPAR